MPLHADQEVTVILVLKEVPANRKSAGYGSVRQYSQASMGAMDQATRTSGELLRTMRHATTQVGGRHTSRSGLACFQEAVWARVPGTRLVRGKFEVNWLGLVWLGNTEHSDEHLCGDEDGVRKF